MYIISCNDMVPNKRCKFLYKFMETYYGMK